MCPVLAQQQNDQLAEMGRAIAALQPGVGIVRAGFAYATLGGVQKFCAQAAGGPVWERVEKEFIIGLHHAISEPSALLALANLGHSSVKVFNPKRRLSVATFSDSPVFHPKVIAVCNGNTGVLRFIQAGSANLTSAALASPSSNIEFGLAIASTGTENLDRTSRFNRWWTSLWAQSKTIDENFIKRYAALRAKVLDNNPLLRHAIDPPENLDDSEYFFLEVGAGSGPPEARHQVEFPETLAKFFGAVYRGSRRITLTDGRHVWTDRPLSFKTTTYGVEIWRLGMPTQTTGGEPIAERAIRFAKTDEPNTFSFKVVDTDSNTFRHWSSRANAAGHIGTTKGQRNRIYGFYS
jgi:hypothetical protein